MSSLETEVGRKVGTNAFVSCALDAILSASEGNGGSYTCFEASEIAELFEYVGRKGDADEFLLNHAVGDDEGDMHRACSQCHAALAEDHGMCGSCLHDAKRSGWEPGMEE